MHNVYLLGGIYAFPPIFLIPFQIFFFPSLLFGHIFAGCQTEKYTPMFICLPIILFSRRS